MTPLLRTMLSGMMVLCLLPALLAAQTAARVWTNQEGRSVTAALVGVAGTHVVIQLADGTRSNVPVDTLSAADQAFLKSLQIGTPAPAGSVPLPAPGALTWPKDILTVDPKSIVVREGLQDKANNRYHYETESFEFISTAPLAGSVMADVAADFILTQKFFIVQPWDWTPRPKSGNLFIVLMAETDEDYIALGGKDGNASEMVNDSCLIRFRALGLKKVGARYQYDSREKEPGRVTSIVAYGMLSDVGGWLQSWTSLGMTNFVRFVAYQNNGSIRFSDLGASVRKAVKEAAEKNKIYPDLNRMLKYMRPSKEARGTDTRSRLEQQMDGYLLNYYFGFLDGDGSGAALHQYYRNVFARSKRSRSPDAAAAMLAASGMEKASPEDMLDKILAGRDDAILGAEMTEKFKSIGIRFDP
ncbi:hypothetical protein WJU23_17970 [Prosthecobacter sp. SYSU 5D2]|uniref:hypothetical protein n=1 Tax=Prosthecobacter sp. SYSU 5D2 TaxID=3134134 RepID=UPI0031FE9D14